MTKSHEIRPYEPAMAPVVVAMWNSVLGASYPLQPRVLRQVTELNPNFLPTDAATVWDGEQLIGFGFLPQYRGDAPECAAWLGSGLFTAIVVAAAAQRQGVGHDLFQWLLDHSGGLTLERIRPGGGYHYIFPGPPVDLPGARPFLESLGFSFPGIAYDVRVEDVTPYIADANGKVTQPRDPDPFLASHGIHVRRGVPEDIPALLNLLDTEFSAGWWYNAQWFFSEGGASSDWLLLWQGERLLGFSQLNHAGSTIIGANQYWNDLRGPGAGGLGPIGIAQELRGKGIGTALLRQTMIHLHALGVTDVIADWTGLLDYYGQFGMKPWKTYAMAERD